MRIYRCQKCGKTYRHDEAYRHCVYWCPARERGCSSWRGGRVVRASRAHATEASRAV